MDLSIFDAFKPGNSSSASSNSTSSISGNNNNARKITSDESNANISANSSDRKRIRTEAKVITTTEYIEEVKETKEVAIQINSIVTNGSNSYVPAKEYKFKLDAFQQTAVDHIERGDSVLVAAHTSAG